MSKPRSPQLREQIVDTINQGMSIAEAVETYQISRRTIYYCLQRKKSSAGAAAPAANRGPKSKLENYRGQILRAIQFNQDLTMKELCELLRLPISLSALSRTVVQWNVTFH